MTTPGERNKEVYDKVKAALPSEFHDVLDELCEELESDFTEAKDKHDEALSEANDYYEDQTRALEAVKYWMQDALVLHKPITDPRKILRMVEDAIG